MRADLDPVRDTLEFVGLLLWIFLSLVYGTVAVAKRGARGRAGRPLLDLGQPTAWRAYDVVALTTGLAFAVLLLLLSGSERSVRYFSLGFVLLCLTRIFAHRMGMRPGRFEITEKGLLVSGWALWPWERVESCKWRPGPPLTLVVRLRAYGYWSFRVFPALKDEVERILAEHVAVDPTPSDSAGRFSSHASLHPASGRQLC